MRLRRLTRTWLSGSLIVLLLFTQLATAAYACPAALLVSGAPAEWVEMPGCDGNMTAPMDPEQPLLCQAHCQQGSQTVHQTPAPDAPATPVLLAVLDWTPAVLLPAPALGRMPVVTSGASPPGSPPLYLCLLVLRN